MTRAVLFRNPGVLDLRALTTFGLSAKPSSTNPIGYFGTGLKYAVAICARLGYSVTIAAGRDVYHVHKYSSNFRGQHVPGLGLVRDGEEPLDAIYLPFTEDLGKHWEPWMAYRELYCNAVDEGGATFEDGPYYHYREHLGTDTTIRVESDEFAAVHDARHEFLLLDEKPIEELDGVRVFRRPGVFRQGVKVGDAIFYRTRLGYDLRWADLTEDRTLAYPTVTETRVKNALKQATDPEILRTVMTASEGTFEHQVAWGRFDVDAASDAFRETLREIARTRPDSLTPTLRRAAWSEAIGETLTPTPVQQAALDRAGAFLRRRGVDVDRYELWLVRTLGEGCLGLAKNGTIYLAAQAFDYGTKTVAATLLEEYLHLERGYADCTRELQNHLFNALVGAWEEIEGEAL